MREETDKMSTKSLQDTFRSVFPNANISFGYKPTPNTNSLNNKGLINTENSKSATSYWPDDPAIVSLNDGTKKLGEKISLPENKSNSNFSLLKIRPD